METTITFFFCSFRKNKNIFSTFWQCHKFGAKLGTALLQIFIQNICLYLRIVILILFNDILQLNKAKINSPDLKSDRYFECNKFSSLATLWRRAVLHLKPKEQHHNCLQNYGELLLAFLLITSGDYLFQQENVYKHDLKTAKLW